MYAEQLRPFDLQLTTGPTVIAPVALVFEALGVGLAQGRAVMAVYTLLAAAGLYRAGWALHGPTVAALAVLVLCASAAAGPADTRDVIGEVAALAYLFWGVAALAAARSSGRSSHYAAAGSLFGLAVLTKGQFGLLAPCLVGAWLLTAGRPGGFPARHLVAVLVASAVPPALWQLHQLVVLGPTGFAEHLDEQSAALAVSAGARPLSRFLVGARTLLSSPAGTLSLVGLGYAWLAAIRFGWRREPVERLLLPAFAAAWLVWYLGLSIGYARYTVPFVAVCALFLALLSRDLVWGSRGRAAPTGAPGPRRCPACSAPGRRSSWRR